MNWKAFFCTILLLIGGLGALVLFSFGLTWASETFGIWWVVGGGILAFIIFIAAIVGTTDRDSPY